MTKIYRTKLSEVKKLLENKKSMTEKKQLNEYEETVSMLEPEEIAEQIIGKIEQIMTDLSVKMHDMSEEDINTIVEYLDKKLGEKIVSMLW